MLSTAQETWASSNVTVDTFTNTQETTIETTPRLIINAGHTAALYNMMFNGAVPGTRVGCAAQQWIRRSEADIYAQPRSSVWPTGATIISVGSPHPNLCRCRHTWAGPSRPRIPWLDWHLPQQPAALRTIAGTVYIPYTWAGRMNYGTGDSMNFKFSRSYARLLRACLRCACVSAVGCMQ